MASLSREVIERRQTARILNIDDCSGGYMRGDGTCQLRPIGPTGMRERCVGDYCNSGPGAKSYYKPK
jgi:hypothetical protein